jgi:hypothetical protein
MSDLRTEIGGFKTLEFDLPSALLEQVITMFGGMAPAPLSTDDTALIPNAQGVYQLFHRERLVYVGKTDADAGLKQRLSRHSWAIKSRHNLNVEDMTFKAIQVLVFSAMDLETALIKHYKKIKEPPVWNGSGFGNNDPGRRRDTTALKEDGFDALYPINIDQPIIVGWDPSSTALRVLTILAQAVPYTVRHEKTDDAVAELEAAHPQPFNGQTTAREVISRICSVLSEGWQATRLSGRVIMYRERVDNYPGSEVIARSGD